MEGSVVKLRNMNSVFLPQDDQYLDANVFLDNCSDEDFFKLRRKIEEEKHLSPIALCSVCFQPVVLRGDINRTKFFAHARNSEDCPIKTTSNLSQEEILAIKYNGQKEGKAHRENKEKIASILLADELFTNDVKVEATFREENKVGIAKRWRRPDISCVLQQDARKIVIELQVSTTFLDVIINRESFYKDNGVYILWVFLGFFSEKFTTLDIAYGNHTNIFVFDSEAQLKSDEKNKLILKCYYKKPCISMLNTVEYNWEYELVDFSSLLFDEASKKIYYIDTKRLKEIILMDIESKKRELKEIQERAKYAQMKMINKNNETPFSQDNYQRKNNNYQYSNKQPRIKKIMPSVAKGKHHSGVVQCTSCGFIGNARKIGNSFLCAKCFQPING